jgi:hypothetical protein
VNDENESLEPSMRDHLTAMAKSALGAVPFAGSLLAEIAGSIIPNQRIDRIVRYTEILDRKMEQFDRELIRAQVTNENFTDLAEESMRQAARSLSEERRDYISSIVANGLRAEDIDLIESRHLLRVLGELNDLEVLWLRYHLNPSMGGDEEFREKHSNVLEPALATLGSSQREVDREALQKSYVDHLVRLGLLAPVYKLSHPDKRPEFDSWTGAQKIRRHEVTPLGTLLLRQIDLKLPPDGSG